MILNFINKIFFDNNYNMNKNIYNEKNEVDLIIKELYEYMINMILIHLTPYVLFNSSLIYAEQNIFGKFGTLVIH